MNAPNRKFLTRALLTTAAVGGVVGLSVWLTRPAPVAPPLVVAIPAPMTPPVAVAVDRTPEAKCDFATEEATSYRLAFATRATIDVGAMGVPGLSATAAPQATNQSSTMTLTMKPLSHDERGTVLVSALRNVQGAASAFPDLTLPFLVRIDSACEIKGFARFNATDLAAARTQQSLMHELQWRFDAEPREVTGENAQGAWRARMVASATDQGVTVQRRIVAYSHLWAGAPAEVMPEDSLLTATRAGAPWFDRLESDETLTTGVGSMRNTAKATRVSTLAEALTGVSVDATQYVWENLLPHPVAAREPRAVTKRDLREREAVKNLTADQSVNAYIERVKSGKGIADTWPTLTTYLEARPDQTEAVVNRLKADMPGEATAGVYIALGRTRTPEALSALMGIKRDTAAPSFERVRAMFSLIDRDDVNASLARELSEDSQALSGTSQRGGPSFGAEALLAVTTMAGLRQEPEVHDIAMNAVTAALANSHTHVQLKPVLRAMANLGDPVLLTTASPYMKHPDPMVRREAAIVFRRMPVEASMPVALDWLSREKDEVVRRHIFDTVEMQLFDAKVKTPMALVERAAESLAKQPTLLQRKALIRLLGRAEDLSPRVRAVLKEQARVELKSHSGLYTSIAKMLPQEDVEEVAP